MRILLCNENDKNGREKYAQTATLYDRVGSLLFGCSPWGTGGVKCPCCSCCPWLYLCSRKCIFQDGAVCPELFDARATGHFSFRRRSNCSSDCDFVRVSVCNCLSSLFPCLLLVLARKECKKPRKSPYFAFSAHDSLPKSGGVGIWGAL